MYLEGGWWVAVLPQRGRDVVEVGPIGELGGGDPGLHGSGLVIVDAEAHQAAFAQVAHRHDRPSHPGHPGHKHIVVEPPRCFDLEVTQLMAE